MRNEWSIIFLITLALTASTTSTRETFASQTQENLVGAKFNPQFTYDWLRTLSVQNPEEVVSALVWLIEDEEKVGMNMSQLKQHAEKVFTEQHSAKIWYIAEVLPFIHIMAMASEIEKIATYEFVDEINLNGDFVHVHPCLSVSVPTIRARDVWDLGYNGSGKRIAIIDTGINQSHPDLDDLGDDPSTSDPKVIAEQDFTGEGITDDIAGNWSGHGTHCAGIAAGTGAASGGVYKGVAPGAWLLEARVYNSTGKCADVNWISDAIDWAVSNDADVISFSHQITYFHSFWGYQIRTDGTRPPSPAADEAVERGIVFVASSGQYDEPYNPNNYIAAPGDAFNVITVGASNDSNTQDINDDTVPWWSSRGPTDDGRPKPDVVAPGVEIMSTWAGYDSGNYYVPWTGTSMSVPHVAGVTALLLQAHPGWTPGIVKSVIMRTAHLNDNLQAEPERENARGKGIVDAGRAVTCPTDIPANQADTKYENGGGIVYEAEAHLNGTYKVMASGSYFWPAWAVATLKKSFIPERDMINPTFLFGFNDTGELATLYGTALFSAELNLWNGTNELFAYSETIHYMAGIGGYDTDCFHAISYAYDDVLLAEHSYDIEYGFGVLATAYTEDGSGFADFVVQALSLSIIDIIGPGNPSFEERLKSVYEPAYWNWSDVDNDWRELKGDICGPPGITGPPDGKVNIRDINRVYQAWGSYPGHPKWDPDCDLNGDDKVNIRDIGIVVSENGKHTESVDGAYSWYTSGNGTYHMDQWLCDHDVNALKGQQVTFSFRFKPHEMGNNATAQICYITENDQQTTVSGNWVYATENWHNANVTTMLPANTVAIKVIIHLINNFQTWIDKTSIVTS